MKRKALKKELTSFFEIFILAALPGLLYEFVKEPSLETLPKAYTALALYLTYRGLAYAFSFLVKEEEELLAEREELEKELGSRMDKG